MMPYTETELKTMCETIAKDNGAELICPVKINGRLTRTLGRVVYEGSVDNVTPKVIEFSKRFVETATPESIQEVVKHEMCHYLVSLVTKKRHGHDVLFKMMCNRVGASLNESCAKEIKYMVPIAKTYKYTITCSSCGAENYYSKAGKVVKNADHYQCACGGKLIVTQNW